MTTHQFRVLQDATAVLRHLRTQDPIQGQAADEAAERIEEVLARDQGSEEVEKPF